MSRRAAPRRADAQQYTVASSGAKNGDRPSPTVLPGQWRHTGHDHRGWQLFLSLSRVRPVGGVHVPRIYVTRVRAVALFFPLVFSVRNNTVPRSSERPCAHENVLKERKKKTGCTLQHSEQYNPRTRTTQTIVLMTLVDPRTDVVPCACVCNVFRRKLESTAPAHDETSLRTGVTGVYTDGFSSRTICAEVIIVVYAHRRRQLLASHVVLQTLFKSRARKLLQRAQKS